MRVNIGPYNSWVGPYQIAEKILFWMDKNNDERVHKFGEWLAGSEKKPSALTKICQFIDNKKTRRVVVNIDRYDTWSMDNTLAHIVLPMLKQLRATKNGAPCVDDADVPDHIKSTAAPAKDNNWDTDDNYFLRWDWVLDEMIFAFETKLDENWDEKFWTGEHGTWDVEQTPTGEFENPITGVLEPTYKAINTGTRKCDYTARQVVQNRINNGFRLFGVYYQGLWD
jgi:hypothetical protein